ncbi:MAG TPA: hypothetical protein VM580_29275 [Labilithrix sp.]|jgi:hypothetical protein|nr:hypothetical protein [Labilithrix sp.]
MHRWSTIAGLSLTVVCIGIAALTGWYSATYAIGFMYFMCGWFLYFVLGSIAIIFAMLGVEAQRGGVLAVVVAVLVIAGGPASCTGSLLLKGHCERKHTTPQGVVTSSSCF